MYHALPRASLASSNRVQGLSRRIMIQERFAISTSHLVMYYDTANGTNISHDPQHDCTARGSASCKAENEH